MITPQDFIKKYSPEKTAELYLHVVDERSILEKNGFLKIISKTFGPLLSLIILVKRDLYLKNLHNNIRHTYGNLKINSIKRYIKRIFRNDHLRKFDYTFQAECLLHPGVKTGILVDFGGGGSFSTFVPVIFRIPFRRLLSFDVMNIPFRSRFGIEYIYGDCTRTGLSASSVDTVMIISTLEHIGLGRYGDPLTVDGDLKAMREAHRILKKGGHLILTIPYGYPTVVYNMNRVYDRGRFKLLSKGFKKVRIDYSLNGKLVNQSKAEGKKVSKKIKGFYNRVSLNRRFPDAQAGLLALLRKI